MQNVTPKTRLHRAALPNPDALEWPGRTARTDYAVFTALVERARLDAKDGVFRASWRELMALAAVSDKHTLQRALKRLHGRHLVQRVGSTASSATCWQFGTAAYASQVGGGQQTTPVGTTHRVKDTGVDYCSLSPIERRVLLAIRSATVPLPTRRAIAAAADLTPVQIRHALRADRALRALGYVLSDGTCWKAAVPDMAEVVERVEQRQMKRYRITVRSSNERAHDAARRLIACRERYQR